MTARVHGFVPPVGERPEAWRDNLELRQARRARVERALWIGAAAFLLIGGWILSEGLK